ncbi:MAG: hypothetical protein L3J67_06665 [Hyphomicrobiaceae bacterium]|nr:hypothetical protein [Hyphomicrobiaceae bacterium]
MMMKSVKRAMSFGFAASALSVMLMVAGGASSANAASKSPFPKLKGSWKCVRGGCWIRPVGGSKERVGCRVRYKVSSGGRTIRQAINCRGSIKMTANAKISMRSNGRVSGSWTSYNNHTGRISGGASGTVNARKLFVGVSSSKGYRGAMRAVVSGKRHTVTLYQTKNGKRHIVGRLSLKR